MYIFPCVTEYQVWMISKLVLLKAFVHWMSNILLQMNVVFPKRNAIGTFLFTKRVPVSQELVVRSFSKRQKRGQAIYRVFAVTFGAYHQLCHISKADLVLLQKPFLFNLPRLRYQEQKLLHITLRTNFTSDLSFLFWPNIFIPTL